MNPVILQIQALLQKTVENGCTEAEALSASAVAQKLLSKHRLSMADIQEKPSAFGEHFTDGSLESAARLPRWKRNLLAAICLANGCVSCMAAGRRRSALVVLGTEEDAALVKAFYPNLRALVNSTTKRNKPPGAKDAWCRSFRLGMVAAISKRLVSSRVEAEAEATSTALVRSQDQAGALNDWVENDLKIKSSRRQPSKVDPEAFMQGVTHGHRVNLSTKVLTQ